MDKHVGYVKKIMQLNSAFWAKYRDIIFRKGVPPANSTWYIKWTYRFAAFFDGIPLEARTADHIRSFLVKLRREPKVEKWQIERASEALRLLYHDYFNMTWAREWAKATHVSEDVWSKDRILFRDEAKSRNAGIVHKDLFGRFRAEIRRRHYSRRTKQSYEDWIRRFLDLYACPEHAGAGGEESGGLKL